MNSLSRQDIDHIFGTRKIHYLNSNSNEFKELIANRNIHLMAHAEVFVNPPYYTIIPNGVTIRNVSPFGLIIYNNKFEYGEAYDNTIKELQQLDKELYEIRDELKNSPYNKKIQQLGNKVDTMRYYQENFWERFDIDFSLWYKAIISPDEFPKFIDKYYLNSDGTIEMRTIQTLPTTDRLYDYAKNIKRKTNKVYREWSELVNKHIDEMASKFNKKELFFLLDWFDVIDTIDKLFKKQYKLSEKTYKRILSEKNQTQEEQIYGRELKDGDFKDLFPVLRIPFAGALKFDNDTSLGFRFPPGSLMPLIEIGGRENSDIEWENYLTFIVIIEQKAHIIYLKDYKFEDIGSLSLDEIFPLVKDLNTTLTLWSCMGFSDGFPSWYYDNKCLGSSIIKGRRRGSLTTDLDLKGNIQTSYTKWLNEAITRDIVENLEDISLEEYGTEDFSIEKNLGAINIFQLSEAFKNTFKDVIEYDPTILERVSNFYKNNLDKILRAMSIVDAREGTEDMEYPSSFLELTIDENYPEINAILKNDDYEFLLEIVHSSLYNIMDEKKEINGVIFNPYIPAPHFNIDVQNIIEKQKEQYYDSDNDSIYSRLTREDSSNFGIQTDHLSQESEYYHKSDYIIMVSDKRENLERRYNLFQQYEPSSRIDYEQIVVCIINLLMKCVQNNRINYTMAKQLAKDQNIKVQNYIEHIERYII